MKDENFDKWFLDHEQQLRKIIGNRKRNANRNDVWVTSEINKFYIDWKSRAQDGAFESPANPYGFFWGAASNKLKEGLRRFKRIRQLGDSEPTSSGDSKIEIDELVAKCLDSFDFEQRKVFVLHQIEGFTLAEVGEVLGKSADQARRLNSKINSKIRKFQEQMEREEI